MATIDLGISAHSLKNVFHIALPAVWPRISSESENVSDAGISPVTMLIIPFVPHEDPAHRGLSQLGPASRRACMGSALMAQPILLEPILGIEIRVPQDMVGNVAQVLSGKRGKVLDMAQKGIISIVTGEIPASETFSLSEDMRGQTAGKAMWNTFFKLWAEIPKSIVATAVQDIRKRKGLAPDPPKAEDFIDKE